jgi:3-oxoacyl-[acyl-carrier-protein] synthase III
MKYNIQLKGIGMEVPSKVLKNKDIEKITPDSKAEWIEDKLGIPESKIYFNMKKYGNTAGASIPMALYDGIKTNKIKNGDNLILAAIGSGWTYSVSYLKLDLKQ